MPRRGQGDGSIRKRPDGRWEARISLGVDPVTGRPRRQSIYGATREEARQRLTEAQSRRDRHLPAVDDSSTVAQYLTNWLDQVIAPHRRPNTVESYTDAVELHIIPALGKRRLSQLQPLHVQAWLNGLAAADYRPTSIQTYLKVLRAALAQAVRWGLLSRNVAALVRPPRPDPAPPRSLTPDQARALLTAARGDRLAAIYTLALTTGIRKGEVLGLRWCDVDLDRGTISIRQQTQQHGGPARAVPLKTPGSARTIPLPAVARTALAAHRAANPDAPPSGLVFVTPRGQPINHNWLTRHWQELRQRAGLPPMRFHDLRHTATTLMLTGGVPPRQVMDALGHATLTMTLTRYAHTTDDAARRTAEAMDALFRPPAAAVRGQNGGQPGPNPP
jgi:integrase